jgi:hypothetical protein
MINSYKWYHLENTNVRKTKEYKQIFKETNVNQVHKAVYLNWNTHVNYIRNHSSIRIKWDMEGGKHNKKIPKLEIFPMKVKLQLDSNIELPKQR